MEPELDSYRRLCTRFYDLDKPQAPAAELAFWLDHARRAGGPVLEPMCGSGRFLLPLLEQGLEVVGTDASPEMLQACREHAARRGLKPELYLQTLEELELPARFNLVMIPAGSFGLLAAPEAAPRALRRLHAVMRPGARLVLEFEPDPPRAEAWNGRWITCPDGSHIVFSRLARVSADGSVSEGLHRYEHIYEGRLLETEWETFELRSHTPDGIRQLLESAGFDDVAIGEDACGEPRIAGCTRP
jgi:SAM-dependent methyltransferase